MLSKSDLDLIEQRLSKQLEPVKTELKSTNVRLNSVDKRLSSVENKLSTQSKQINTLDKHVNSLDQQIKSVKKDTSYMVNFLDRENLKVVKRVEKIEKHLGLPTPQLS